MCSFEQTSLLLCRNNTFPMMKKFCLALCAVTILLSACSHNSKPSTTPLHPSHPAVVPVSEDEMHGIITAMTTSTDWQSIVSADLLSLMNEAQYLVMGNATGETYSPFDWSCHTLASGSANYSNNIKKINITDHSVTVDMMHVGGTHCKPYTLVMKHEKGHWCIDDIYWTEQQPPRDTERHHVSAYSDDAITNLTTGDAAYIVATRLDVFVPEPAYVTPEGIDYSIKCVETAHNFLKKNRGYSTELEGKILSTLQHLNNLKH